jgi:hypothetical protein
MPAPAMPPPRPPTRETAPKPAPFAPSWAAEVAPVPTRSPVAAVVETDPFRAAATLGPPPMEASDRVPVSDLAPSPSTNPPTFRPELGPPPMEESSRFAAAPGPDPSPAPSTKPLSSAPAPRPTSPTAVTEPMMAATNPPPLAPVAIAAPMAPSSPSAPAPDLDVVALERPAVRNGETYVDEVVDGKSNGTPQIDALRFEPETRARLADDPAHLAGVALPDAIATAGTGTTDAAAADEVESFPPAARPAELAADLLVAVPAPAPAPPAPPVEDKHDHAPETRAEDEDRRALRVRFQQGTKAATDVDEGPEPTFVYRPSGPLVEGRVPWAALSAITGRPPVDGARAPGDLPSGPFGRAPGPAEPAPAPARTPPEAKPAPVATTKTAPVTTPSPRSEALFAAPPDDEPPPPVELGAHDLPLLDDDLVPPPLADPMDVEDATPVEATPLPRPSDIEPLAAPVALTADPLDDVPAPAEALDDVPAPAEALDDVPAPAEALDDDFLDGQTQPASFALPVTAVEAQKAGSTLDDGRASTSSEWADVVTGEEDFNPDAPRTPAPVFGSAAAPPVDVPELVPDDVVVAVSPPSSPRAPAELRFGDGRELDLSSMPSDDPNEPLPLVAPEERPTFDTYEGASVLDPAALGASDDAPLELGSWDSGAKEPGTAAPVDFGGDDETRPWGLAPSPPPAPSPTWADDVEETRPWTAALGPGDDVLGVPAPGALDEPLLDMASPSPDAFNDALPDPFADPFAAPPAAAPSPVAATGTVPASPDAYGSLENPTPTMITRLSPEQLRALAARLVAKGALTREDYQAAKQTDGNDPKK